MSLNLVSPGVKVREVDLTIGNITGAQEQVGAIAGPFEKGPIDVPLLIENEQDLIATYGKPLEKDGQFEYWMTASSYLSYGGTLRVLRSDGENLNNANATVVGSSSTVKIKSYDDYTASYTNASNFFYAAKNPGTWGNGLKVFTIDHFADQVITIGSTAGVQIGMGVTQSITGRTRVGPGTETTYGSGFMRGIITGVGATAGIGTDQITVKVVDRVTAEGIVSATTYDEVKFLRATSEVETTQSSTGIGTTAGIVDTAFDSSITGIGTTAGATGISTDIQLGDVVTVTGGNSTVAAGTTVVGLGVSTVFVSNTITGISTAGDGAVFTFSRGSTTTTTTNTNTLFIINDEGTGIGTYVTTTNTDWYNSQKLGLTKGSDIAWNSIAEKPGTSEYAKERQSQNDEMHVVVIDEDGSATGIAGNVVEKHLYLSKAKDGKRQPTEEVYYKNYLANKSEYIYAGAAPSGKSSSLTAVNPGDSDADIKDFTATSGNWGANAAGTIFNVEGNRSYDLTNGKNYSGTENDGYLVQKGDVINSYNILKNPAEYTINFILQGPSGGATIFEAQAKASALIAIAELRKDCIACISPYRNGVVNIPNSDTQTDNIVDFYGSLQSSSYAVFDSGYKYTFDRFNNEFRYIPLNGDVGGLMARTSINSFSWFSPAGASRGAINGAVKLAYNPSQAQRDIIYPKRINPVIASPGAGIILFGDRTGLGVASAFDRINVRRLFLTVEGTIERAARDQLFEFNDVITRTNFLNIVDPFLRDVKAKRGITDFVVICDETNNTPDVIDANQFRADIFIKPARSINFIGLTFVATRTGVSFEEVVGNV